MGTYSSTSPETLPSFMLALTFFSPLGRQLLRNVAELCKHILLVRCRVCAIHVGLLTVLDFEDIDECWG